MTSSVRIRCLCLLFMAQLLPSACGTSLPAEEPSLTTEIQLLRKVGQELADAERQLETGLPILRDHRGIPLKKEVLEAKIQDARAVEQSPSATAALRQTVRRAYLERQRSYLEIDLDRATARGDAYAERRTLRLLEENQDEINKLPVS
ncbi:MAG: hypothetical protein E8D45_09570 [Nitrospira sp.]|nr:MAG: hypothetical protein E8D45_09570 [Nitrospira sp.]